MTQATKTPPNNGTGDLEQLHDRWGKMQFRLDKLSRYNGMRHRFYRTLNTAFL
jgi:hypothetical protein